MLPDFILPLYSHASYTLEDYPTQLSLRPDANCLFNTDYSRQVSFLVPDSAFALLLEQRSFYSPVSTASRVPCWSTSSIQSRVPVALSQVYTTCNGHPSQYRFLKYYPTSDTPIYFPSEETISETEICTTEVFLDTTKIYFKVPYTREFPVVEGLTAVEIKSTIDTQSTASVFIDPEFIFTSQPLAYESEEEPQGSHVSYDIEQLPGWIDWTQPQDLFERSQAVVSGSKDGWLPSRFLGQSMFYSSPMSCALGLQAAVAVEDVSVTVLILRQLSTLIVRYGWLTVSTTGELVLADLPPSSFGFPVLFSVFDVEPSSLPREVLDNALLGLAICKALAFLQDEAVQSQFALSGEYYDFKDIVRLLVRGLSQFCAGAILPSSQGVAFKAEFDYYLYAAPSYAASFLTDVFLSSALLIAYDLEVETKLARLNLALQNLPLSFSNPFFYSYVGGTDDLSLHAELPNWMLEEDLTQEEISLYFNKMDVCCRALWALRDRNYRVFQSSMEQFESLRLDLRESHEEIDLADYLAANLYLVCDSARPFDSLSLNQTFYAQDDFGALVLSANVELPVWVTELQSTSIDIDWVESVAAQNASLVYLALVNERGASLLPSSFIPLLGVTASAQESWDLVELRRMMPYGTHWFSTEKVNDISSNIGSMLYSEAALSFARAIAAVRIQESRVPVLARSEYLTLWLQATLSIDRGLYSDAFIQRAIAAYIKAREVVDIDALALLATEVFNVDLELIRSSPPPFCAYKTPYPDNETLDSFSSELKTYTGYLDNHTYRGCTHKRVSGAWRARVVAGFPVLDVPEGYLTVTSQEYVALTNSERRTFYAVKDGEIYILPTSQYTNCIRGSLPYSSPRGLAEVSRAALPVGTRLFIDTEFVSVGD